jgi:hypothetical protein
MSETITKAFADYQAAMAAPVIQREIARLKAHGITQSAADIRCCVAMELRDAIEKEVHRLGDLASESVMRRRARRMGYSVSKSRDRSLHSDNRGQFMLCDERNVVVLGDGFDASLQDVADYLTERAA